MIDSAPSGALFCCCLRIACMVLVNAAELGSSINAEAASKELDAATAAVAKFEGQPTSTDKIKAQQELARARARVQASKA